MRKFFIFSLLALASVAVQAQKERARCFAIVAPVPQATTDEKTGLKTIKWPDTENNSWHENIGILDNVPTEKDYDLVYGKQYYHEGYVSMSWRLTDEGKNTVLHCYFLMKSDVVTNLWLGNSETTILDKETGIIYQAKSTVPERCFNKVFGVKGKEGTILDLQIIFPKLPETAKDLAIYGVPNWFLRGLDVNMFANAMPEPELTELDKAPAVHEAHKVKDAVDYNKDNHESWAVYNDAHTIKPVKENTMALWLTADATYLAIATEQNWIREYYGRGGNTILLDNNGNQYKCKDVIGYPNDDLFWLEGYPGDYFAMVLVFEPLMRGVETFTYIVPEGEPFNMWGANWNGEVITNLNVNELRKNQHLFDYHPRVVVK